MAEAQSPALATPGMPSQYLRGLNCQQRPTQLGWASPCHIKPLVARNVRTPVFISLSTSPCTCRCRPSRMAPPTTIADVIQGAAKARGLFSIGFSRVVNAGEPNLERNLISQTLRCDFRPEIQRLWRRHSLSSHQSRHHSTHPDQGQLVC